MKSAFAVILLLFVSFAQSAAFGDAADADDEVFRPGRIEILVSANTMASVESFFGHSSILIIPEGGTWEDGRVFDFMATTNENNVLKYYAKGVSGQFPFALITTPARDFLYKRLFQEQRSVQRLILPATQTQKQALWDHLLDLQRNPKKMGDYYFVRYNCATAVLGALKYSGIQINTKQIVFTSPITGVRPTQLPSLLRGGLLTPYFAETVPSNLEMVQALELRWKRSLRSQGDKNGVHYPAWPAETLALLPKLSTEDLVVISGALAPADQKRAASIQQILQTRMPGPTHLIRYRELPQALYDTCERAACAAHVAGELKKLYAEKDLHRMARANALRFADSWTRFMPEIDFETSPQVRHWRLLNEALGH